MALILISKEKNQHKVKVLVAQATGPVYSRRIAKAIENLTGCSLPVRASIQ